MAAPSFICSLRIADQKLCGIQTSQTTGLIAIGGTGAGLRPRSPCMLVLTFGPASWADSSWRGACATTLGLALGTASRSTAVSSLSLSRLGSCVASVVVVRPENELASRGKICASKLGASAAGAAGMTCPPRCRGTREPVRRGFMAFPGRRSRRFVCRQGVSEAMERARGLLTPRLHQV